MQELSDDERAVLMMLIFYRRYMPDLVAGAEAWHAAGRPSGSAAAKEASDAEGQRTERLTPALLEANRRNNELIAQGREGAIVKRLKAWGLWTEPNPPPPEAEILFARMRELCHEEH